MILDTICIMVICTIITDILQFWDNFSTYIKSWMTGGKFKSPIDFKLFQCSTCQTHWLCLIYLIVTNNFSILNYTYILGLSFMTPVLAQLLSLLRNIFMKLIYKISELLGL